MEREALALSPSSLMASSPAPSQGRPKVGGSELGLLDQKWGMGWENWAPIRSVLLGPNPH